MTQTNWYKNAVIYQIYPRSFCDSNHDGMGDIKGIISKLDYLQKLGVNCVWLSPVYNSPQDDNGYDISDYRNIYPPFGTLEDFKEMIEGMHKRGIRLIMDLVVNHTSDEHKWFQEALKDKNSPYRDYYYFKKGKGKNGKKPPNNWTGFFGGSTWEKLPNEDTYYLHLFTKKQPDLNWENEKVRQEVKDILKYWLDMGVDGFRCDVITLISKKQDFKSRFPKLALVGKDAFVNGPRLHEFLHELNKDVFSHYDVMTVGETVLSTLEQAKQLVEPSREELTMVFNFDHTNVDCHFGIKYIKRNFKLKRFKKAISHWQIGMHDVGWNSLFIENHDQRRSAGRFGTDIVDYPLESAKMLATTYFFLQGTPFIYQGQEIGMQNADFKSIDDFADVEAHNMYNLAQHNKFLGHFINASLYNVSRDNARTPMQWNNEIYSGFSDKKPWLKVNDNYKKINVENSIKDPNSIYHYYQELIKLHNHNEIIEKGEYIELLHSNSHIFAYRRVLENKEIIVISSFSKKEIKCPLLKQYHDDKLLISNYNKHEIDKLLPYETRVYYKGE